MNKKGKIKDIAFIILCIIIAILGFTGIWVPNRFGTGMPFLLLAASFYINYRNEHYK